MDNLADSMKNVVLISAHALVILSRSTFPGFPPDAPDLRRVASQMVRPPAPNQHILGEPDVRVIIKIVRSKRDGWVHVYVKLLVCEFKIKNPFASAGR